MNEALSGAGLSDSVSSALTLRLRLHDVTGAIRGPHHRYLPQSLTSIEVKPEAAVPSAADRGAPFLAIDTRARDAVADTVAVNRGPVGGMVISADGGRLMVTNYGDDSVSMIDTGTGAVVHTVFGTSEP
ncbi:MAG: YncE family protein, partial [Mycobacterium sp.]